MLNGSNGGVSHPYSSLLAKLESGACRRPPTWRPTLASRLRLTAPSGVLEVSLPSQLDSYFALATRLPRIPVYMPIVSYANAVTRGTSPQWATAEPPPRIWTSLVLASLPVGGVGTETRPFSYSTRNLKVRAVAQVIVPRTEAFASNPQTRLTWSVLVTATGTGPAKKAFTFGDDIQRSLENVASGFICASPV